MRSISLNVLQVNVGITWIKPANNLEHEATIKTRITDEAYLG